MPKTLPSPGTQSCPALTWPSSPLPLFLRLLERDKRAAYHIYQPDPIIRRLWLITVGLTRLLAFNVFFGTKAMEGNGRLPSPRVSGTAATLDCLRRVPLAPKHVMKAATACRHFVFLARKPPFAVCCGRKTLHALL